MPYIPLESRKKLQPALETALKALGVNPTSGELNYFITKLLDKIGQSSYEGFNSIIGVLECIKQEFYRKVVASYEDRKCRIYGEVYRQR